MYNLEGKIRTNRPSSKRPGVTPMTDSMKVGRPTKNPKRPGSGKKKN